MIYIHSNSSAVKVVVLILFVLGWKYHLYAQDPCVHRVVEEIHKAKDIIASSTVEKCILVKCNIIQEFRSIGQNKSTNATEEIQLFFAGEAMRMVSSDREILQDKKSIITIVKSQKEILHLPIPASAQVNTIDYRTMMLLAQEKILLSTKKSTCKDSIWKGQKVNCIRVYLGIESQVKTGMVAASFIVGDDNKLKAAIYTMIPESRVRTMTIEYSEPEVTSCPKQLYDITKSIYTAKGTLQEEYKGYKLIKQTK